MAEANGGEATIMPMGPDKTPESIRMALSMGVGKAVHVDGPIVVTWTDPSWSPGR